VTWARRLIGQSLQLAGAALLGYAATSYVRGALARNRAREAWTATGERLVRSHGVAHRPMLAEHVLDAGEPLGRLRVPKLGLDEIIVEGVGDGELAAGSGHVMGSAVPGELGNAILSAHRDGIFNGLDQLEPGDTVVTDTPQRQVWWVVSARRVVDGHAPLVFDSPTPLLTLTTEWPVRWIGPASEHLLVTATPVAGAWRVERSGS